MRAEPTQRWIWMSGALAGVLLLAAACDQDAPLAHTGEPEAAQVQLRIVPEASAKLASGDEVRVLVWHVRDLVDLPLDPAGKPVQFADIDFDPNDWLAWAAYLQHRLGFGEIPERSATLRLEQGLARASLRVRAGEKHLFVGRFRGGVLTHTGQARVGALPGKVNLAVVHIATYNLGLPLEFSSAALAAMVQEKAGSLLPGDVASLRVLDVSDRGIDDLTGIEQLTGLRTLDLSGNQIGDAEPLASLIGLTALDLSQNQLVDVVPLSALEALVTLNLSHNRIVDVSPLAGLTGLTELDLRYNEITDVGVLAALTGLIKLDVRDNPLAATSLEEQISALELPGLVEVLFDPPEAPDTPPELSPGQFADMRLAAEVTKALVRNLTTDLTRLTDLSVGGKGIGSVDGIQHLTRLSDVDLAGNEIEDLSPLAGLTRLNEVDLRNNQITDISPLVENPGLGEGDRVDLRGNDLGEEAIAVQIPILQERGVEVLYDNS